MNKRHYEHTLPNIRGSLSNTYKKTERPDFSNVACRGSKNRTAFIKSILSKRVIPIRMEQGQDTQLRVAAVSAPEKEGVKKWP